EFVSLEMGRNFFSLRAVTPIFYDGKLLGYMELGREIDHFFGLFKKQTGFDISLLLDNKYVEKYRLMTDTHLVPDGKSIGDFLILNSSNPQLAATLLQNIKIKDITKDSLDDFWVGGTAYSCYSKNIYDANGELAGRLLFSSDNTKMHSTVAMQYIVILVLTLVFAFLLAYGMKAWIQKEILKPIEKIRSGVVNFFDFIKGDTKTVKYIEPMKNNEIGFIGNVLNENMTETIRILKQNKTNEAYLLQRSRVVALGEMISNIAYHWRQPLNVISVVAQDMRYAKAEGELSDEYFNNSIEKIVDTSKNLSITLNKFSNFYKQPKNKEIFCVEDEIGRSIDFFKDINADLHAKIEYVFESKHMIKNYKGELSQAALNILKNANEAILRRNVQDGRIAISVTKKENSIKISISDNGGGIGAQEMEKIFDPYFTTKYKTNDVGLGLYLTKMMIEKNMGGILTAQNDEDGLKIEIELPLTKES
ncbi:MAG: ATP-binding protein, partial [Campylobacterales bacterium]